MACCCTNIYDICQEAGCSSTIELPMNATTTGDYKYTFESPFHIVNKTRTIIANGSLDISSDKLNGDATYILKITDPNGVLVSHGVYDCFRIKLYSTI